MEHKRQHLDLDIEVAEKVLGLDLIPSRDRAKTQIARRYIGATGPIWFITGLDGEDIQLAMPSRDELPEPADDVKDYNAPYFIYVFDYLNRDGGLEEKLLSFKTTPPPYSSNMLSVGIVLDHLASIEAPNGDTYSVILMSCADWTRCQISGLIGAQVQVQVDGPPTEAIPMAVCKAALALDLDAAGG